MKKFLAVLTGVAMFATMAVGFVGCGDDKGNGDEGKKEQLAEGMFDISLSTGMDTRLKMEVKDGGYLITYSEIARNEYIAVSADVFIDTSTQNTFTMEYENKGTESVYVSLEFMNADGKTGYGGGDMAPGEKTDVVDLTKCHQYGTGTPLGTVTKVQMFFDSGWSQIQDMNLYSGTIFIKSIKLSYVEPEKGPELPDDSYNKLATSMGDLWKTETVTTLSTDNNTKTITRVTAAGNDGDYGNSVALNINDFSAQCEKIVLTLGEESKFNMCMIQMQDDDEVAKLISEKAVDGKTELIIDLTAAQAMRFAESSKQYFVIWLDANSGNGTGKMVIEKVEFFTTQEISGNPEQPSEDKLATSVGDLWKHDTITMLSTDNDAKTITRVTAAGESGDYGSWAALNINGFSADCRKIVFTLGEETSFNMTMIQIQNDGEIINQNWGTKSGSSQLVIEITEEQAQKIAAIASPYFMIWLDANSGNGTGKMVIASVEFYAAEAEA